MLKVRIGFGLGTQTGAHDPEAFAAIVDALEDLGFDSLWLSEQLTGPAPDPLLALAFAAGRTERLKLGTSVLVVPGRNPVVLAKEMATLDRISAGRFLPAVGLGAPRPAEHRAFGVDRKERAGLFDESLGLMRRLWTEDDVTHDGARFHVEGVTLRPTPVQDPFEVWMGGRAPSELRRVGRLGDGWLPSFCTVGDVAEGWAAITATAAGHGRTIDPQHLGALVPYSHTDLPDAVRAAIEERRPGVSAEDIIPVGLDALRARLEALIAVGASKFVVVPTAEPTAEPVAEPTGASGDVAGAWETELTGLVDALFDLQT